MGTASKHILFVMGVSGSGKSTIGKLLAKALDYPFFDGDDFHTESNIKKMSAGKPLTDEDRHGWLMALNDLGKRHIELGAVIACSALKESYRGILQKDIDDGVHFIYLKGSFEDILERLKHRQDHFMPVELLKSQFDLLSPPKNAIEIDINQSPDRMVQTILNTLDDLNEN